MKYTTNLQLKKPDYVDPADIGILNENMDIVDAELKKVESQLGDIETFKDSIDAQIPLIKSDSNNLKKEVANLKLYQEASERIENGIILGDNFLATPINMELDNVLSSNLVYGGLTFFAKTDKYIDGFEQFTPGTSTSTYGDVVIESNSISVNKKYAWDAVSNPIDLTNIKEIRAHIVTAMRLYLAKFVVHTDPSASWSKNVKSVNIPNTVTEGEQWITLDVSELVGIHYIAFSSYYINTTNIQIFLTDNIQIIPQDDLVADYYYKIPSSDEICLFMKQEGDFDLDVYANDMKCSKEQVDNNETMFFAKIEVADSTVSIRLNMSRTAEQQAGKVTRILGGISK